MKRILIAFAIIVPFLSSGCAPEPVSVILTAFGDKEATFGETQPYLKALEEKVDRTKDSAFCEGLYEGKIFGQPVVVATTGTGTDNVGPCMHEILHLYNQRIKEVIWSGIGGASPAVGGIIDLKTDRLKTQVEPVMIGDVCISPLSWNYDLHFSSVADWRTATEKGNPFDPAGGWWSMKNSEGKADVPGFENVQQFVIADKALADELLAAAKHVDLPAPESDVRVKVKRFFSDSQMRKVQVFDYTQCGEVAGNNFWHGVVEDRLSRQYLAGLINASQYAPQPVTEHDVVVFSAMEATAWMSIVSRWSSKTGEKIPMVVVRAASNYTHVPLDANGQPQLEANGAPMAAMDDIQLGFQEAGASFAWTNAALPVLKMFELRQRR
jgi:purine nucleoside permease